MAFLATFTLVLADDAAEQHTRSGIREFYAAFHAWDLGRFGKAEEHFRKATAIEPNNAVHHYWLGVASFHRMLYHNNLAKPDAKKADAARKDAMLAFEAAINRDPKHSESHALLATMYGMKIGGSLLRGVRYGPTLQKHQKQALAAGMSNPRVMYLYGAGLYHTSKKPADYLKALDTLATAEKLFLEEAKRSPKPLEPRWGLSSCRTFIGLTNLKLGRKEQAAASFKKALAEHPNDHIAQQYLPKTSQP